MIMTKTVGEWIMAIGADLKIENTVSKKAERAIVKKKYIKTSFGFNNHGIKIKSQRVESWVKAELDGTEYLIMIYRPGKEDPTLPAKTHYQKI